jgi:hypothetical protein
MTGSTAMIASATAAPTKSSVAACLIARLDPGI